MKMKRKLRKFLLMLSSAILLVSISVGATVAYLTDTDSVKNTFTVGNVQIELDEADVDIYGEEIKDADRVKENEYKLIPGHTYTKDPTITVKAGSEKAYLRMLVTVKDYADLLAALNETKVGKTYIMTGDIVLLEKMVTGFSTTDWEIEAVTFAENKSEAVYEFRYNQIVDASESETDIGNITLFETFTLPGCITNNPVAEGSEETYLGNLEELEINVVAHAIQADGFGSADAAWGNNGWKVNHPD